LSRPVRLPIINRAAFHALHQAAPGARIITGMAMWNKMSEEEVYKWQLELERRRNSIIKPLMFSIFMGIISAALAAIGFRGLISGGMPIAEPQTAMEYGIVRLTMLAIVVCSISFFFTYRQQKKTGSIFSGASRVARLEDVVPMLESRLVGADTLETSAVIIIYVEDSGVAAGPEAKATCWTPAEAGGCGCHSRNALLRRSLGRVIGRL
jgi:hypothetical protein